MDLALISAEHGMKDQGGKAFAVQQLARRYPEIQFVFDRLADLEDDVVSIEEQTEERVEQDITDLKTCINRLADTLEQIRNFGDAVTIDSADSGVNSVNHMAALADAALEREKDHIDG